MFPKPLCKETWSDMITAFYKEVDWDFLLDAVVVEDFLPNVALKVV